jgi:hypothetical protein
MVRIDGQAFGLCVPALTDALIGGKPSQGFVSFGNMIGHQKRVEMLVQVLMGLIRGCFHRSFFASSIQTLYVALRPGVMSVGQPRGDGVFITDACKAVCEGLLLLLPIRQREPVVGAYGVKLVRNHGAQMAQDLCRHRLERFSVPLGIRDLRGAVDGDDHVSRACFGAPFGHINVAVAHGRGLERFLLGRVTLDRWPAADAVPQPPPVQRRSRQVGHGRWSGVQAIPQPATA